MQRELQNSLCIMSYTRMLLIITNAADIHPNPVIEKLNALNIPLFRLNTDKLLTDYDISYSFSEQNYHFSIRYKRYPIEITSEQISCVWERRPMEPLATYDDIEDELIKKTVLNEAEGFLRFFRYALIGMNVLWIGHPINERLAGSKILQKMVAQKIGFAIPKTLFSNHLEDIDSFLDNQIAVKPIRSFDIPTDEENSIVFYTQRVTKDQLKALGEESFRNTINFLEDYTEKDYELRITVIHKTVLSAKVLSQELSEDKGAIDWRQGYEHGIKFVATDIPDEIKQACLKFLEYFNLEFGCFDIIKNKKGQYVFLECNTNGQWLWLEEDAGLPISQTLANLFIKCHEEHKTLPR